MAINTEFLPQPVQAALAANPDLYKRSITDAPDRARSLTIDMGNWAGEGGYVQPAEDGVHDTGINTGTGEGAYVPSPKNGIPSYWGVNTGNGSTPDIESTYNGLRLFELNGSPWQMADSTVDFSTKNWKPGAEQAVLGSAKWDDQIGLMFNNDVISKYWIPDEPSFMDKLVPGLILGAVGMGVGQMAGLGAGAASGGAGGAAAGGGAGGAGALAAEGATGLASLPAAGTWAQTAIPAVGAGAGSWTLPASLAGIEGATAAGGFTMADAIRNGMQNLPVDIGEGLTTVTPKGGFDGAPGKSFFQQARDIYNTASKVNKGVNAVRQLTSGRGSQDRNPLAGASLATLAALIANGGGSPNYTNQNGQPTGTAPALKIHTGTPFGMDQWRANVFDPAALGAALWK